MNKILKVMCFILFALFAGINTIYAQGQSPTGLVVDENGQPMIGVQIIICTPIIGCPFSSTTSPVGLCPCA